VDEAAYFAEKLTGSDLAVDGLVVNRMHPRFGAAPLGADRARAATLAGTGVGTLYANLADFRDIADGEERHLSGLARSVDPRTRGPGPVPGRGRARPPDPGAGRLPRLRPLSRRAGRPAPDGRPEALRPGLGVGERLGCRRLALRHRGDPVEAGGVEEAGDRRRAP
jgi:hypothetical protein